MKKAARWLVEALGAVLAALPALPLGLTLALNSPSGLRWLERVTAVASGGDYQLGGLDGRFPDDLRVGRVELVEAGSIWLRAEAIRLRLGLGSLAQGRVDINELSARRLALIRMPVGDAEEEEAGSPTLPISLRFRDIHVGELSLEAAVTGMAARFSVAGEASLGPGDDWRGGVRLTRTDSSGRYDLSGAVVHGRVTTRLEIEEPAGGFLAHWAGLPDIGALRGRASWQGPPRGLETEVELTARPIPAPPPDRTAGVGPAPPSPGRQHGASAPPGAAASRIRHPTRSIRSGAANAAATPAAPPVGELRLDARGRVDWVGETADARLTLTAPAMRPAPELAWQGLSLRADLHGPWTAPRGKVDGQVSRFTGGPVTIRAIRLDATGDADRFTWLVDMSDIRHAGKVVDLLDNEPLQLRGLLRPEGRERLMEFELRHPDLNGGGRALLTDQGYTTHVGFRLPNLDLASRLGGQPLTGTAELSLDADTVRGETRLKAEGRCGLVTGPSPWPDLLGPAATLRATARLQHGGEVTLDGFHLLGRHLAAEGRGRLAEGRLTGRLALNLPRLERLHPGLRGQAALRSDFDGPPDDLGASLDINGELGMADVPPAPWQAQLRLQGWPGQPSGHFVARGTLAGAPLDLRARLHSDEGRPTVSIEQAGWQSLKARGRLRLPANGGLPEGRIETDWARLEDLRPLAGLAARGSLNAHFTFGPTGHPDRIDFGVMALGVGLGAGITADTLDFTGRVDGVDQIPRLTASLLTRGLTLRGIDIGEGRLDAEGPLSALALSLTARAPGLRGDDLTLATTGRIDLPDRLARLESLAANWRGETLRLLAPASMDFRRGLRLGDLRLGLGESLLEATGPLWPDLDFRLKGRLRPADLATLARHSLRPTGRIEASASLTGSPEHPRGALLLEAREIHAATGPPSGLPPLDARLSAELSSDLAHIDGRLEMGPRVSLQLSGEASTQTGGPLNLRATGRSDLAMLDPWLSAEGRRLHGRVDLDARLQGRVTQPEVAGTLRLNQGEAQDYAQGINLSRIEALLEAGDDGRVRLRRLEALAGPGTLRASGDLDLKAPDWPVNLILTARNAQPLASDRLTANLDGDLQLRGALAGPLTLSGPIRILGAEIRIPENMPAHIAILRVRRPGEAPSPPIPARPGLNLDLQIGATRRIFVRGRGIDAELDGSIRLKGPARKPETLGHFSLRRGQLNLAGQTLNFSKGDIGFTGGQLNDPSLDFEATVNRSGTRAILNVGGTARKPVIALSSVPALPEDEILAQLLFGKSATALSPFEMARIAGALVSLTGATSGMMNPLEKIRRGLGLDRLTVGSDRTGNPTLEAGRYVMPGVYLGAKQGTTGSTPQSVIQVDITDNLKVEGTIGAGNATGSTGNAQSAGVVYQFEY